MEKETKKCPYCGEEILAIAQKCKYCGEWLEEKQPNAKRMKTCPVCAEQIEEDNTVCPYCHESLTPKATPSPHHVTAAKEQPKATNSENKETSQTSFLSHYFTRVVCKQYADFSGTATRKQYWLYVLFYSIIAIATSCIDILLGIDFQLFGESLGYGWLFTIASLALTIPSLAIGIRRLHDIGKSGWWFLIVLIPLVGVFWLLFLLCKKGNTANASTPLTTTDKIVLNASIIFVTILVILTYFKSANHLHTPQLQHSDWTLDGDTAGVDTLDNIGYSESSQSINSGNDAEIKKRIIHDFSCYYAIYTFCYNMKQAITNGYRGIGLEGLDGDPIVNDDLLLISNEEYRWLLQQFDFSNFSRLLRAYANDNKESRSDYFTENDLGHIAIKCLKERKVVCNSQWFEIFNSYLPYNEVQIEEFHNLGNKEYQVVFDGSHNISPNFVYKISYANGLTITTY